MFIATLFTMAKTWKQPISPSTDEVDKEDVRYLYLQLQIYRSIYIYNGISLSRNKEWNAICSNMDGGSRTRSLHIWLRPFFPQTARWIALCRSGGQVKDPSWYPCQGVQEGHASVYHSCACCPVICLLKLYLTIRSLFHVRKSRPRIASHELLTRCTSLRVHELPAYNS